MRLAGRIQNWNDDKGYGFVAPTGGGSRTFVHIKAFQRGSRRPVEGDLVSYAVSRDARGRPNAVEVRFAGQRIEQPRNRMTLQIPRRLIGISALLVVVAAALLGLVPVLIAILYWVTSGLSYLIYFSDKAAAGRRGVSRTPESTLHMIDLLGGWPGALIAQQRCRHKTAKASFQTMFFITVIANIVLATWLVRSDRMSALNDLLIG